MKEDAQNMLGQGREGLAPWWRSHREAQLLQLIGEIEGSSFRVQKGARMHLQGGVELLSQLPVK